MDEARLAHVPTTTLLKMVIGAKLKEWFMPQLPGGVGAWFIGQPRTDYNYRGDLGDGLGCSVIMPVVQWLQRAFCEAPLIVQRQKSDEWDLQPAHPLAQLIARPNDFYGSAQLWMATIADWCWCGESYWRVLRDGGGRPAELWWLPPWSIQPKWPQDGSVFISHYEYTPDGKSPIRLDLEDVVHFRHGLDPRNPRHGLPPLRAVLRDIWADEEAGNWVGSLLRNMGIPGLILSPKGDSAGPSSDEVEQVKAYVKGRFTGDLRGEPMVLGGPTEVTKLAFSPSEFDLSAVRNTAEERVSAALGIPSAVVGFHSGLESTKVGATMREYVGLAWSNGIIPIKRIMGDELFRTLMPAFEPTPDAFRVYWDYSEVNALQEDENAKATRVIGLVTGGIWKVSEGRRATGLEAEAEDEIYLRSNNLTPTDPKDQMPEPEPMPLALPAGNPPAHGDGNGNGNGARNGAVAVQQRAFMKQSLDEWLTEYLGRTARSMDKPPQSILRLAARLSREETRVRKRFEPAIRRVFDRYAEAVSTAAREILKPQKASAENIVRAAIIGERLPMVQVSAELGAVYQELYQAMLEMLTKALREAGQPELTSPSRIQAHLQMLAQDRIGLLDLSHEARIAILDTLEQATVAGLSEDDMITAIKDAVPRGRWLSVDTRAQIIARTESRFSLNMASSQYAREQGLQMLVFDAQLGPTDFTCEERRGWIVTPAQAAQLAASEHPSGTFMAVSLPSQVMAVGSSS
jgi:HK97 family phage portal protein